MVAETERLSRQRTHQLAFLDREFARREVQRAVQAGELAPPSSLPCLHCGKPARDYHHHNGYRPEYWLDVIPLCRSCHGKCPKSPRLPMPVPDGYMTIEMAARFWGVSNQKIKALLEEGLHLELTTREPRKPFRWLLSYAWVREYREYTQEITRIRWARDRRVCFNKEI